MPWRAFSRCHGDWASAPFVLPECLPPRVKGCRGAEGKADTPLGVRRKLGHLWGSLQSRVFPGGLLMGGLCCAHCVELRRLLLNGPTAGLAQNLGAVGSPTVPLRRAAPDPGQVVWGPARPGTVSHECPLLHAPFPASDPRALHLPRNQQSRGPGSLGAWASLPPASPQVPALGGLSGASEEVPSSCLLFSP